jgi:hypothetical protein
MGAALGRGGEQSASNATSDSPPTSWDSHITCSTGLRLAAKPPLKSPAPQVRAQAKPKANARKRGEKISILILVDSGDELA